MRRRLAAHGVVFALGVVLGSGMAHAEASPHLSENYLPSSNGIAAIAWDRSQSKIDQWLEHPYQAQSASVQTRNFVYDTYPGVRIGTAGTWLNSVTPSVIEYLAGTGIVHTTRTVGSVTLDEYDFAPMGLAEHASVMLLEATQTGAPAAIDGYALFNFHLGSGSPAPGTDGESITYDGTTDAYYETGPSGVAFAYGSISPSTHHGCTPDNPFNLLQAGSNLADDASSGGATNDAVAGLQDSLGSPATGAHAWAGWVTILAPDANGAAAMGRARTWLAGRTADQVLSDEVAAWQVWTHAAPPGASDTEAAVAAQAQVVLRMGQVAEPGGGQGQLLASVAPGAWNIAWVRDMAYAVVGLVRSGHLAEAKAAIEFQMQAQVGSYQQYVGAPYQISVVRYYGDGTEWSDSNADGPNIEFDGFGLFLWELDQYVAASGDTASLAQWWPTVKAKVADVLVKLQEPSGLVAPDSSIWEVHWDGQQKHFAYTTITAANGLCAASRLANAAGDANDVAPYLAAGQKSRDALLPNLRAPSGALGQSTEALAAGTGWLDAATLEAIGMGLVDPTRATAGATLTAIEEGLVPASGRGFMRSDAGDWYSSNEWVFIDLRAERALELHGDPAYQASLFGWNVAQASDNYGELSELHDPTTADYAGQSPMVGFGAGAYLLALYDRGKAGSPACGDYAAEPGGVGDAGPDGSAPVDAGVPVDAGHADAGQADGGAAPADGGANGGSGPDAGAGHSAGSSGGCGCSEAGTRTSGSVVALLSPALLLLLRRKRRSTTNPGISGGQP
ncbi:MAG TPA: glycoside hydrolase family 15 protein [Polyangiaceae bacterium]|jgi:GH15 family glucan-1,4-alpha-glucosidase